jgi:prepilin-type N-terminal cleavage/methylation domain-containing protein
MLKLIRRIPGNKGVTLIELMLAMLVMAIIMIAATTVFAPMLQAYQRANNLAEVNTLLDNISALIMNDVASATEINPPGRLTAPPPPAPAGLTRLFSLRTTHFIDYYIDANGYLWRDVQGLDEPLMLLPLHFYKFWGATTVFRVVVDPPAPDDPADPVGDPLTSLVEGANGVVTFTLTIRNQVDGDGWSRTRTYTTRPIGLVP